MKFNIPKEGLWIGDEDDDKPHAITLAKVPLEVLKKYASKRPRHRPMPPKKGKKK